MIATTHLKFLVYPGQKPIQSRVDTAHGVISLFVPLTDVGNPPVGAPFNVYEMSAVYRAILTAKN